MRAAAERAWRREEWRQACQKFWQWYMNRMARHCNGCDDSSPHDSHLTRLGRRHFT